MKMFNFLLSSTISLYCKNYGKYFNIECKYRNIIDANAANTLIYELLQTDVPCIIYRYGGTEFKILREYEKILFGFKKKFSVIYCENIFNLSCFFPANYTYIVKFCKLMHICAMEVDLLGVWLGPLEEYFQKYSSTQAKICKLRALEPYYHTSSWTRTLEGKSVLIIHPFDISIQKQYQIRGKLFTDKDILPFFELKTLRSVQGLAGNDTGFTSWFDALGYMKDKIASTDYDFAILSCSAYAFPLASFIKTIGKKAIHLGGATQILFGIRGNRWDTHPFISKLYNKYWCSPSESEYISNANIVENSCYW